MTLYKRFRALPIEPRWLGLEAGDNTPWFCTPVGAQIIGWSRAAFEDFLHSADNAVLPEQQRTLEVLAAELALTPMEDPYAYVRGVQAELSDLSGVRYSDDYYDTLGLERPDGTQPDMACMEFEPVTFRLERNGATFHD